jgi:hypothetical protein
VAVESQDATSNGLITLDLETGDVRWRSLTTSSESVWTQYFAAAGHVFSLSVANPASGAVPTTGTVTAWH